MPDELVRPDDPESYRRFMERRGPGGPDGDEDAWTEEGSDELMDFDVLVRIKQEAELIELARQRRIERRAE